MYLPTSVNAGRTRSKIERGLRWCRLAGAGHGFEVIRVNTGFTPSLVERGLRRWGRDVDKEAGFKLVARGVGSGAMTPAKGLVMLRKLKVTFMLQGPPRTAGGGGGGRAGGGEGGGKKRPPAATSTLQRGMGGPGLWHISNATS